MFFLCFFDLSFLQSIQPSIHLRQLLPHLRNFRSYHHPINLFFLTLTSQASRFGLKGEILLYTIFSLSSTFTLFTIFRLLLRFFRLLLRFFRLLLLLYTLPSKLYYAPALTPIQLRLFTFLILFIPFVSHPHSPSVL